MADWALVPCLVALRGEFNEVAPNRDKATDGSIGDAAHKNTNSDHNPDEESDALRDHDADSKNEVHAIDVDVDLRVPGLTMERIVQHLVKRCRAGAERRLKYIIYNRRIWSPINDWAQRSYSGANPHTAHAHFSASYETAHEASTASWHLGDLVALTDAEIEKIAKAVWNHEEPNPYDDGATKRRMGGDLRYMEYRNDQRALATNVTRLDGKVIPALGRIEVALAALMGRDFVDEQAIVTAVLTGLSPDAIASAVVAALPTELAEETASNVITRLAEKLNSTPTE